MSLQDSDGKRKYLTKQELNAFLAATEKLRPRERAFCQTLAFTGARISECAAIRKQDVDKVERSITIRSLKKRGDKAHWRSVPVPAALVSTIDNVSDLSRGKGHKPIWKVTVRQAFNWVKEAMKEAGLDRFHPHSLRHTYGVNAVVSGVPVTSLQRWLGHASVQTTSIYCEAQGEEERALAERMWA